MTVLSIMGANFLPVLTLVTLVTFATYTMRPFRRSAGAGSHRRRYFWSAGPYGRLPRRFFFLRNRFIIHTLEENWFGRQSTPDRLETAVLLKDIVPPSHLPCLHFLELIFPRLSTSFLASDKPVYHDWIKTIECVNDKLNFSKLTLRVCFREDLPAESDEIHEILASEEGRVI